MSSAARPEGPDGALELGSAQCVVRFERSLDHPVEQVWAALTEPERLAAWWGRADLSLVPGGRFVLEWINTDDHGHRAVMHATITELQPPALLELTGDLHGVLRFELLPDGAGTHLSFSSTLALPEEFRAKVLAGWHFHLDALARSLDGQPTDLARLPGWEELHARYARRLEP